MNLTILGGGNIGMCILAEASRRSDYAVTLVTSHSDQFHDRIWLNDVEKGIYLRSGIINVSNDVASSVRNADIVFCTYPSFMREKILDTLTSEMKAGSLLGFFPGYGGAEYHCQDLLNKGVGLFALQKVPYVARTEKAQEVAGLWSRKSKLRFATLPAEHADNVKQILEDIFEIKSVPLSNYLSATLLPGNPLLHTAGSCSMLRDYNGTPYEEQIFYYRRWDDDCSRLIFRMSDELMAICDKIPMDLSGVESIGTYYEAPTPEDLTKKFHSIPSFRDLTLPMKKVEEGFIPDFSSRFFTEDIPFGVCLMKGLAQIVGVDTPAFDEVLEWYRRMTGKCYYFPDGSYGPDAEEAAIPQRFGISSVERLLKLYSY